VRLAWDEKYLYIGAHLINSDIVQTGENHTHLYQIGDLIEIFLKPEKEEWY